MFDYALSTSAGATITKPLHHTDWGSYCGHFRDPDGFLWEVAWNPHFWIGERESA